MTEPSRPSETSTSAASHQVSQRPATSTPTTMGASSSGAQGCTQEQIQYKKELESALDQHINGTEEQSRPTGSTMRIPAFAQAPSD